MRIDQKNHLISFLKRVLKEDVEPIKFVRQVKERCSSCTVNPITGHSTNPNCPECKGTGVKTLEEVLSLNATVDYGSAVETELKLEGLLQEGQVSLLISLEELDGIGVDWKELIKEKKNFDYVYIDDIKYSIISASPEKLYNDVLAVSVKCEVIRGGVL